MPIGYSISAGERLAVVTALDAIDLDIALAAGDELAADPAFQPGYRVLVDVRKADFAPTSAEIESFSRTLPRFAEIFCDRIALVASGDLQFGITRMICLLADLNGFPMRPFTDIEEARAWLLEETD